MARAICVHDDDKVAARYGRHDPNSPYRFYYQQMRAKMKRGNRLYVFTTHKEQPPAELPLHYVIQPRLTFGNLNQDVAAIIARARRDAERDARP